MKRGLTKLLVDAVSDSRLFRLCDNDQPSLKASTDNIYKPWGFYMLTLGELFNSTQGDAQKQWTYFPDKLIHLFNKKHLLKT